MCFTCRLLDCEALLFTQGVLMRWQQCAVQPLHEYISKHTLLPRFQFALVTPAVGSAPQERLAAAVTETITAAEAAADEAAQQIMTLQQDSSRLQATNAALHQTLEEVHAAAASFKEQLVTAGYRERELQRQLLQAQLMFEEQAEQLRVQEQATKALQAAAAAAADAEDRSRQQAQAAGRGAGGAEHAVVQALLQQRDTANAALAEAQDRLLAQEAELQQVRKALARAQAAAAHMSTAGSSRDAAGVPGAVSAGGGGGSGARPPALALQGNQQVQQAGQQGQQHTGAQEPPAAAGEPSGSSWLDPDWQSALPSPALNKLLQSPRSGASFWLDSARDISEPHLQQGSPPAAAAGQQLQQQRPQSGRDSRHPLSLSADSGLMGLGAVGAAKGAGVAALAAQLLNREASNLSSISNSLEDAALVMLGSPGSPRAASRLQQQRQQETGQQMQQMRELAAALAAAQATTERQRAVISALRQEMEELQAAGAKTHRFDAATCIVHLCQGA